MLHVATAHRAEPTAAMTATTTLTTVRNSPCSEWSAMGASLSCEW